ncbi:MULTISPECIES: LysE family translocator [Micromonospora]|uniref:Threonine/homoserine/homoserine lactone efflux protein n=1 Tax=Micromonospora ureilytica TaxID=709868 RepID=A0ABS0JG21_9ACTN|nr:MULTISPECIES: LysE family translocator [Micromonospora]MBG6066013.1 threonine/homoserine/homoserine lactone efflux protein [Micromonospora ureilytica]MBQ1019106.1 LysE family translocator [Micromonospora sp. D93]WSR54267.1 LysE family translocator [Micromonospora ureilytica]
MTIPFLITTLIVVVTPGTGVIFTLSAGLSRGARAGVLAAFACTLGTLPHLLAAMTGLAALMQTSAAAFETVRYLGVGYLLYLAWSMARDRDAFAVTTDAPPRSAIRVIVSGVLVNLLNPKPTMFFVAFLPQFVDTTAPGSTRAMLGCGAVFMLLTFVVFSGYGVFAARVRDRVLTRPRVTDWLRRSAAGTFVALGVTLALTER